MPCKSLDAPLDFIKHNLPRDLWDQLAKAKRRQEISLARRIERGETPPTPLQMRRRFTSMMAQYHFRRARLRALQTQNSNGTHN
ncbi:hypothetical protein TWF281_005379 [Arthrobotrys megalospora]